MIEQYQGQQAANQDLADPEQLRVDTTITQEECFHAVMFRRIQVGEVENHYKIQYTGDKHAKQIFQAAEEGIAKGSAAVSYKGKMVDTPVYENALQILRTMAEIKAADAKS